MHTGLIKKCCITIRLKFQEPEVDVFNLNWKVFVHITVNGMWA